MGKGDLHLTPLCMSKCEWRPLPTICNCAWKRVQLHPQKNYRCMASWFLFWLKRGKKVRSPVHWSSPVIVDSHVITNSGKVFGPTIIILFLSPCFCMLHSVSFQMRRPRGTSMPATSLYASCPVTSRLQLGKSLGRHKIYSRYSWQRVGSAILKSLPFFVFQWNPF